MSKTRISKVAKELGVSSDAVLAYLRTKREPVKSTSSSLKASVAKMVEHHFAPSPTSEKTPLAPKAPRPQTTVETPDGPHVEPTSPNTTNAQPSESARNTAVFIDLENLTDGSGFRADTCSVDFVQAFTSLGGKKRITCAYAYASIPVGQPSGAIVRDLRRLNVVLRDIPGHRYDRDAQHRDFTEKDAADFQIYVDAIDLASRRTDIGTFVIMSSDNGFYALANKLRELGKSVIVAVKRGSNIRAVYRGRVNWVYLLPEWDQEDGNKPKADSQDARGPAVDGLHVPIQAKPHAPATQQLPPEVLMMTPITDAFGPDERWQYCTEIASLFQGPMGAVVQARGSDGLTWADALASVRHLIPGGTAESVGFPGWTMLLRYALPKDYAIMPGDNPAQPLIIDAAEVKGRPVLTPLSLEDLGDPPEINRALRIAGPVDTIPYVIEWCATADGQLTANECYQFFADRGKDGPSFKDVSACFSTLAMLDLLKSVDLRIQPTTGQVVARGRNSGPDASEVIAAKHYIKCDGFTETIALEKVIEEITTRAHDAHWPFGPKTRAALALMQERIDYAATVLPSAPAKDGAIVSRGVPTVSQIQWNLWESLPDW